MTFSSARSGSLGSPLARVQSRDAASDGELTALRRAAWRLQGVVTLRLSDIGDDWLRQAVRNEAERLYGKQERRD